ncbi:MAG TPA: sugar transferase, partial [Acidimicrobiia bacterium]|nr:sugar transferase [Acidimicrobiia bacterium]
MTDSRARIDDHGVDSTNSIDLTAETPRIIPLRDVGEAFGRPTSMYETLFKPIIDGIGAICLLVVTLPLMLAIALAIRATMGRGVILKQERVGQFGKLFILYKFRTMEADRRQDHVPFVGEDRRRNHKDPDDPRITPVGRFLRTWSLDELPQFVNVLKGDMSLVGPRPELPEIVARYEPWQHQRHAVRPGITGLWQISERGDKPLHECTESDLAYLDRLTLGTDLMVLVLTPLAALGVRRG